MTFLADENFPRPTVYALRENGFEIAWVTEDSPGSPDQDVLARCAHNQFTLLTLDKDFGELVFRRGFPAECGSSYSASMLNPRRSSPKLRSLRSGQETIGTGSSALSVAAASG
jgi:predicted nuclease of predicted toxin-antitoxin system